jgi:hypothetical protein
MGDAGAHEAVRRAGGLYPIQMILDPGHGRFEQVCGYGALLVQKYPITPRDTLIIVSNSGEQTVAGHGAPLLLDGRIHQMRENHLRSGPWHASCYHDKFTFRRHLLTERQQLRNTLRLC